MKQRNKNKKVRVQDIADILKISTSSVSRALNNHPRISKKTKDKVLQIASQLGYYPNVPELMTPKKTEAVIILVPNIEDSLYRKIISGISERLSKEKYQTLILDTQDSKDNVRNILETYHRYGINGIIQIVGNRELPKDYYNYIENNTFPIVTIFRADEEPGLSTVMPDIYEGISKIVNHLKVNNINKLSLVLEDDIKPYDYLISSSFKSALEINEFDCDLSVYYLKDEEYSSLKLLLKENKPQAVFVKNHFLATEVRVLLENMDLSIPENVLMFYSGIDTKSSCFSNSMSLLKIPAKKMGFKAAELLLEQISNPNIERKTSIVPVNFILKSSALRV